MGLRLGWLTIDTADPEGNEFCVLRAGADQ